MKRLLIITFCMSVVFSAMAAARSKPNIVIIMADDIGYEGLGCYGSADYKTPHLDKLAKTGMRFTNCYSQPLCTPSRVQIMTGRYNHRNYVRFGYLDPKEITFGNILKDAGYRTCIAGKWQLSGNANSIRTFGFDEHCLWNMENYTKDSNTPSERIPKNARNRYTAPVMFMNGKWHTGSKREYGPQIAVDFICSFINKNKARPFVCYYPMILVHSPFVATPDSKHVKTRSGHMGKKGSREEKAKQYFQDMVEYMDKSVGQIVAQLTTSGVLDDTMILFTGDNGTHPSILSKMNDGKSIKGGKAKMTDAGTLVPFVAYWKGVTPEGVVNDDLIDFSDFLPTVVDAAGASLPADRRIDGVSFLPQLKGEKGYPRDWTFCHYVTGVKSPAKAREYVRDKRYKLYDDGKFYDVKKDVLEENPLSNVSGEAAAAKKALQAAYKELHAK